MSSEPQYWVNTATMSDREATMRRLAESECAVNRQLLRELGRSLDEMFRKVADSPEVPAAEEGLRSWLRQHIMTFDDKSNHIIAGRLLVASFYPLHAGERERIVGKAGE